MLNEVKFIGRLGNNPEIKDVNGKSKVVSLSVATWKNYMDSQGDWQTITQWHRVVCWNKAAERCEKIKKGSLIFVSGELTHREYEDKDGIKRNISEVVGFVRVIQKQSESESSENTNYQQEPPEPDNQDEDLPF